MESEFNIQYRSIYAACELGFEVIGASSDGTFFKWSPSRLEQLSKRPGLAITSSKYKKMTGMVEEEGYRELHGAELSQILTMLKG